MPFFRTCLQSCDVPVEATVEGAIPSWVNGVLVRTGPGLKEINGDRYKHMFDGLSLLHQFTVKGGTVSYCNKFLKSDTYEKVMKAQRIVVSDFGTRAFPDPCKSLLGRYMSYFTLEQIDDNCSINLFPVGDQVYASTESTHLRRINASNIDTLERLDLDKYVAVNTQTAHPHVEKDGTVYNLGSRFGTAGKYCIIKLPATPTPFEDASILCEIPTSEPLYPSYYHSFCITENYIVFIEQPLIISLPKLKFFQVCGISVGGALQWRPDLKTKFHVIRKETGEVLPQVYLSEPFAFFHSINAYEDSDTIVCDICAYDDGRMIQAHYHDDLRETQNSVKANGTRGLNESKTGRYLVSQARRYALPLQIEENCYLNQIDIKNCTAKAHWSSEGILLEYEGLSPKGISMAELPRINYKMHNGKKYRYFYSISRSDEDFSTSLLKFDVSKKSSVMWSEKHCYPSEPVFVARPGALTEDDGVILSAVLSEIEEDKGFLLVLDAQTFEVMAKAHFETPSVIPTDFHGIFVEDMLS